MLENSYSFSCFKLYTTQRFLRGVRVLPAELTVTEAISFSSYTRVHLYNLINAGRLKSRRAKMRAAPVIILIDRASLEAYMQEQGRAVNGEKAI